MGDRGKESDSTAGETLRSPGVRDGWIGAIDVLSESMVDAVVESATKEARVGERDRRDGVADAESSTVATLGFGFTGVLVLDLLGVDLSSSFGFDSRRVALDLDGCRVAFNSLVLRANPSLRFSSSALRCNSDFFRSTFTAFS